jgi:hypothetical protein
MTAKFLNPKILVFSSLLLASTLVHSKQLEFNGTNRSPIYTVSHTLYCTDESILEFVESAFSGKLKVIESITLAPGGGISIISPAASGGLSIGISQASGCAFSTTTKRR